MNAERNHALCEDCYAGLVDVGEARPDPRRIDAEYRYETACCSCAAMTRSGLFLDARPRRFPKCGAVSTCDDFRSIASFSRSEFNATLPADYKDWGEWLIRSMVAA
jgi:hypothetical protein